MVVCVGNVNFTSFFFGKSMLEQTEFPSKHVLLHFVINISSNFHVCEQLIRRQSVLFAGY